MEDPIYTGRGKVIRKKVNAANTASDGSGTIQILQNADGTDWTAGVDGARLDKITYGNAQAAPAASSAMIVKMWVSDPTGLIWTLIPESEAALATATRSATVIGAKGEFTAGGIDIDPGCKLGYTQSVYAGVQDQMQVTGYVADY